MVLCEVLREKVSYNSLIVKKKYKGKHEKKKEQAVQQNVDQEAEEKGTPDLREPSEQKRGTNNQLNRQTFRNEYKSDRKRRHEEKKICVSEKNRTISNIGQCNIECFKSIGLVNGLHWFDNNQTLARNSHISFHCFVHLIYVLVVLLAFFPSFILLSWLLFFFHLHFTSLYVHARHILIGEHFYSKSLSMFALFMMLIASVYIHSNRCFYLCGEQQMLCQPVDDR